MEKGYYMIATARAASSKESQSTIKMEKSYYWKNYTQTEPAAK